MMRTTIFRSNRMAIAMVGAFLAPAFAFGQEVGVTDVTPVSYTSQAQTRAAAPTLPDIAGVGRGLEDGPCDGPHLIDLDEEAVVPVAAVERVQLG